MSVRCLRYLALFAACISSAAFAQDALVLETLQGQRLGDWITAAQRDPSYEGQQVGVLVRHNTPSREIEPCGRYRIEFDPATAPAFEVGACDPRTNATWLRLLSRVPLFETTSGPFPRPRDDIRVSALVTFGGTETAGNRPEFESRTDCAILERVFERNMLRPQDPPFEFTPPAYRLVPLDPDVQVQPAQNGWLISRPFVPGRTTGGVRYEIQDAQGRVVLQNRVSQPLECRAAESQAQMEAPPPAAPPPSAPLPPPPAPTLVTSPSPSGVFSLAGELHGLPIIYDGAAAFGGGLAGGVAAAFTLELPPWVLLTAKLSVAGGNGLLGMVTAHAAVSFHLSPMTALYIGPAARLWGVSYSDSSQVGGLDVGGVAGLWIRYHGLRSDGVLFIETMAAPWTDSLWTVTVGWGFGGRTY